MNRILSIYPCKLCCLIPPFHSLFNESLCSYIFLLSSRILSHLSVFRMLLRITNNPYHAVNQLSSRQRHYLFSPFVSRQNRTHLVLFHPSLSHRISIILQQWLFAGDRKLESSFIAQINLDTAFLAETDSSKSLTNISQLETDILTSENFVDFKELRSLPQILHRSLRLDIK